ncbi:MAG: hypothetical protein JXR37_34120 [Kiritimatiellae bacterium]|nr:hypothetical protein [Kiritimatiellia bacterium]
MRTWILTAVAGAVVGAGVAAAGLGNGKTVWRSIGPAHFGAMYVPTFSPHDPKVIVCGTDMGNAFMTRDGGKTWKILGRNGAEPFGNPGYRGMWNCCFDPKRPARIFIGSEHGLYRTTDGGENWRLVLGGTPAETFGAIAVDPTDPNIVYAANGHTARSGVSWSRGDVWKSADGGDIWRAITPGGEGQRKKQSWIGMVVDRQSAFLPGRGHSRMYLYGHQDFMVSEDAGTTWASIEDAVPGGRRVSALVLVPGKGRATLFAGVAAGMVGPEKDQRVGGVYRSDDGGKTWTQKNKGLDEAVSYMATKGRNWYSYFLLAGCAARPNVMYLACQPFGIFKSEDGGETWRGTLNTGVDWVHSKEFDGTDTAWRLRKHRGNLERSFYSQWGPANGLGCSDTDPNAVAYTDNATIGVSFDGGERWTEPGFDFGEAYWPDKFGDRPPMICTHKVRSRGIQVIQPRDAAIDPFDPNTIAIGHDDIGLYISRDGGEWWEWAYHGLDSEKKKMRAVLYDPGVRGRMYVGGGQPPDVGHVYRSDDGGRTFTAIGIPDLKGKKYVHALALDPSSAPAARALYAGTDNGLYKTVDGGKTWALLAVDAPGEGRTQHVTRLAVDPTQPARVFAGMLAKEASGLYRSENRGATWRRLAADKIAGVKTIAICKATGTLYVVGALPGARGSIWDRRALWRSDDHGDSWRKLDDRKLIAYAAVHPADPERVYMTTGTSDVTKEQVNVWRSRDGGKTWEAIADDIPLDPLGGHSQMVFDPSNPRRFLILNHVGTFEGREAR